MIRVIIIAHMLPAILLGHHIDYLFGCDGIVIAHEMSNQPPSIDYTVLRKCNKFQGGSALRSQQHYLIIRLFGCYLAQH